MNYKSTNKKGSAPKGKSKFWINQDPFFDGEPKKRRKTDYDDDIDSGDSEDYENEVQGGGSDASESEEEETADEKRKRFAEAYLKKIREIARREKEEEEEEEEGRQEVEKEGERDSLVAKILQQEQLEESGRVRRVIASR